jgi:hypothetical protein
VVDGRPLVKVDDKLVRARPGAVSLSQVPYFQKGFIQFSSPAKRGGELSGNLTATQDLRNCYLVYETYGTKTSDEKHHRLFGPVALPDLAAGQKVHFSVSMAIPKEFSALKAVSHIFSGHGEYMTSQLFPKESGPRSEAGYLAAKADRDAVRVLKVPPVYPKALGEPSMTDAATVRVRVGLDGETHDVVLVSASDPQLGPCALASARQWVFAPAVANHQFVETILEIPIDFAAP